MHPNQAKALTVEQIAERFSVSSDTIYRCKREGDFQKALKLGAGTTRWKLQDIEEWENSLTSCLITEFELDGFFNKTPNEAGVEKAAGVERKADTHD